MRLVENSKGLCIVSLPRLEFALNKFYYEAASYTYSSQHKEGPQRKITLECANYSDQH